MTPAQSNSATTPATLSASRARSVAGAGQYAKGKLISVHGPDIPLPDLLVEIARCERRGQMHDACGVSYIGLTDVTDQRQ